MQILWWILGLLGLLFFAYMAAAVYLATVLRWEDEQTVGLNYYGRPAAGRSAYKEELRAKAQRLAPLLKMMSSSKLDLRKARIQYKGVSGPTGSCSVESFQRGADYQPLAMMVTKLPKPAIEPIVPSVFLVFPCTTTRSPACN